MCYEMRGVDGRSDALAVELLRLGMREPDAPDDEKSEKLDREHDCNLARKMGAAGV